MATSWTPERKAQQGALIRKLRPWDRSTGPRTLKGKAIASRNAYAGGLRATLRELARAVNAEIKVGKELVSVAVKELARPGDHADCQSVVAATNEQTARTG